MIRKRQKPKTIERGNVIFFVAGDPPRWRRTRLGRAFCAWRGRRQMRGWVEIGVTDETGIWKNCE